MDGDARDRRSQSPAGAGAYERVMLVRATLRALMIPLALAALLAGAAPAHASFHLIQVRQVYPGAAPTPDDAFVELQMYSTGENHVAGHQLQTFAAGGAQNGSATFAADVARGDNQSTILIGDSGVPGADLVASGLDGALDPAGGAVCWDASRLDCVSWGGFSNSSMLATGTAATAIPDGQALTREISAGCATLLEASDDTNDSAADFELTAPSPRPNASAPTEIECSGGGGSDTSAPQTKITKGPKRKIAEHTVKVKFRSSEYGSSFRCKLDKQHYKRCTSPRKLKRLEEGRHKFRVRATDAAGNPDPTPAKVKFKVV